MAKKLLFLICIYFCNSIAMEVSTPQKEEKRSLEALSLALPNYPIYTNPTNYEEAYKEINKLMRSLKPIKGNIIGFSFLEILKKEYDSLNKQKAILMTKFDLSSSQKKLILQQEETRLNNLEQQLEAKSKALDQLIEKAKEDTKQAQNLNQEANGILNEYRESKLQLQNMILQNEQYFIQLKAINDSLNKVQQKNQQLAADHLELKNQLTETSQQLKHVQESTVKTFWQRKEFYYGIATGLGLLKLYSWFRPSYSVDYKH